MNAEWRRRLRKPVDRRATERHSKHAFIAHQAGITPETPSRILNSNDDRPALETIVRIYLASRERLGYIVGETATSAQDDVGLLIALYGLAEMVDRAMCELEQRIEIDQLPPIEESGAASKR